MKLSLWLRDDLGDWAKAQNVNLSATLSEAVEALRAQQPGETIEAGVIHSGDDLVIEVERADGIDTSAPRVRIKVATVRRWVALLDGKRRKH